MVSLFASIRGGDLETEPSLTKYKLFGKSVVFGGIRVAECSTGTLFIGLMSCSLYNTDNRNRSFSITCIVYMYSVGVFTLRSTYSIAMLITCIQDSITCIVYMYSVGITCIV